jgi:hypothetical protein
LDGKPYVLPGGGVRAHPFLYSGEWDTRKTDQSIFLVRHGKVVWHYHKPLHTATGGIQEFDDSTYINDGPEKGDVCYSCMSGAGMVNKKGDLVWSYQAPPGTEVHSCQWLGNHRVLIMRNGNPMAHAMIFDVTTNTVVKDIAVPVTTSGTHGQFRHVRMTPAGTILVPYMSGKVVEYDQDGNVVWQVDTKSPWAAVRLKNGNTLIAGDWSGYAREVNPKGETVWELTQADVPFKLYSTQTADRLANGDTIICNWCSGDQKSFPPEKWNTSVQFFEVTPDKKVVWAVSSWDNPDLGTSTSIQLLDEPGRSEDQQR